MMLSPFQIKSKDGKVFIVNTETGTEGPKMDDTKTARASLKKAQAKLNSSIALDRMGIF